MKENVMVVISGMVIVGMIACTAIRQGDIEEQFVEKSVDCVLSQETGNVDYIAKSCGLSEGFVSAILEEYDWDNQESSAQ